MNAPSDNDPDWQQIRPWLDEALDRMNPGERDALLLRFFEQSSFKEIALALRSGEDAARKRVERALDKLRLLLLRRGITTSASALALALAARGVEIAPSGLAGNIAVASAAIGASALTTAKIMTMSQLKTALAVLVAVAGISTAVVQHRAVEKLRAENEELLAQTQKWAELQADNARLSNLLAQAQRPQLAQEQMSELLRLRGQVGVLRDNLRKALATNQNAPLPKTEALTGPAPSFTSKLTAQIGDKQTLLTGGWQTSPGKRTFMLLTPNIDPTEGSTIQTATDGSTFEMPNAKVTVDSHLIEMPETMLAPLGLDQFKTDSQDSSVQTIFAASDAEALLNSIATNEGVVIANPRIISADGIKSTISASGSGDLSDGAPVYSISLTPNLTADKTAVNMAIEARLMPTATPHSAN
jgi:hypothetical protein